jgi:hypothetical protein
MNVKAFKEMRGYGEKSDAGTQYLANAIRCVQEKNATYLTLAKFKYPTLSAVAVKDYNQDPNEREPMTTKEAFEVLKNGPFAPVEMKTVSTEDVVDAMNCNINTPFLPSGDKNK